MTCKFILNYFMSHIICSYLFTSSLFTLLSCFNISTHRTNRTDQSVNHLIMWFLININGWNSFSLLIFENLNCTQQIVVPLFLPPSPDVTKLGLNSRPLIYLLSGWTLTFKLQSETAVTFLMEMLNDWHNLLSNFCVRSNVFSILLLTLIWIYLP